MSGNKRINAKNILNVCETMDTEIFSFLKRRWNVSLAKRLIRSDPSKYKVVNLNVDDWFGMLQQETETSPGHFTFTLGISLSGGEKHAMETDPHKPGIVIVSPKYSILIDGWHRLYKAKMIGMKIFKAYLIDDDETIKKVEM